MNYSLQRNTAMFTEKMTGMIETERTVLFPFTKDSLSLFNMDLPLFEKTYGVV